MALHRATPTRSTKGRRLRRRGRCWAAIWSDRLARQGKECSPREQRELTVYNVAGATSPGGGGRVRPRLTPASGTVKLEATRNMRDSTSAGRQEVAEKAA